MTTEHEIGWADVLLDEGDIHPLPDGRELRLRIAPDVDYDGFSAVDCYGRIAPDGPTWDCDGHRTNGRPAGFDGNAERLSVYGGFVWWQPPADVKRSDPGFADLRSLVIDLASFGWYLVTVELLDGIDAYGRPIVTYVASLGGIDSLAGDNLAEVVNELVGELPII